MTEGQCAAARPLDARRETIRYALKPHQVFLFDRETETRVPFEVM